MIRVMGDKTWGVIGIPCLLVLLQPLYKRAGNSAANKKLKGVAAGGLALKQMGKYVQRMTVLATFNIAWPRIVKVGQCRITEANFHIIVCFVCRSRANACLHDHLMHLSSHYVGVHCNSVCLREFCFSVLPH